MRLNKKERPKKLSVIYTQSNPKALVDYKTKVFVLPLPTFVNRYFIVPNQYTKNSVFLTFKLIKSAILVNSLFLSDKFIHNPPRIENKNYNVGLEHWVIFKEKATR